VVRRLLDVGRAVVLGAGACRNSCILCTALTIDAARHFGVAATPLKVRLRTDNAVATRIVAECEAAGRPAIVADPEAWSVGLGFGSPGEGATGGDYDRAGLWPGHLVAIVAGRWLVDLSADQANSPEHGIELAPLAAVVTPRFLAGDEDVVGEQRGCRVQYRAFPGEPDWTHSPQWDPRSRRGLTEEVIRRMLA
jgi:hypothetical protein